MQKLLTIVVPSYNVENTIEKTLDSFIINDKKLFNRLEVFIVNDGSLDGTAKVANRYVKRFPDVFTLINKTNGGHGSTINVGIVHATGKYFKVVDGDDWVDTPNLIKLLEILETENVDVIGMDYYRYNEKTGDRSVVKASEHIPQGKVLSFDEVASVYSFVMHSSVVKTEILQKMNVQLEEHCYYTDVEFDTCMTKGVQTILYVEFPLYCYRIGQVEQSVSVSGWLKHRNDHIKIALALVQFYLSVLTDSTVSKEKKEYIERRVVFSNIGHYRIGLIFKARDQKIYMNELKEFDDVLKETSLEIYNKCGKDIVVKICRRFDFSFIPYYVFGLAKKLNKLFVKK